MKKVLLIDDQETVALVLRPYIMSAGLAFDRLEKFVELPRVMLRNPPDLVILDLSMPTLAGEKIGEMIRKRRPDVPIVIYSSRNEKERETARAIIGADAHMSKSADKSELVDLVLDLIRRRAA